MFAAMQTLSNLVSWNAAANETVREMVKRPATAVPITDLRAYYNEMASRIQTEPDIDPNVVASLWTTFGALCRASSVVLAGESLLWQTVVDTVISKQRDYGKENIKRFGQIGLVVRTHDKLARLEHLAYTNREPGNESLKDTVLDLVGYSVLAVMLSNGSFDLPLV